MPQIDSKALESILWETHGPQPPPHLDPTSDDGASAILDQASRRISTLRYDHSLHLWHLAAISVAAATAVTLGGAYGDFVSPVQAWYDWPLVWGGSFLLVAIALSVILGITFFLHNFWWEHIGGGRRDAEFYGDQFARRPGAARPGTQRLPKRA